MFSSQIEVLKLMRCSPTPISASDLWTGPRCRKATV